uniref:NADH dehydrogenase subunit 4L n=1 Tax=Atta colombica TaxID=520822 RepID=A0A249RWI5_9HYME|nr:NADH dehydrogenase subunit 4L [Atta colombica]
MMIYMQIFLISMMLLMLMYKHMLIMLMMMELLVINMSMIIYIMMVEVGMEFYLVYYLIFSVCESVLGLSLLVMIVRFSGNDLYYMFNFSKF